MAPQTPSKNEVKTSNFEQSINGIRSSFNGILSKLSYNPDNNSGEKNVLLISSQLAIEKMNALSEQLKNNADAANRPVNKISSTEFKKNDELGGELMKEIQQKYNTFKKQIENHIKENPNKPFKPNLESEIDSTKKVQTSSKVKVIPPEVFDKERIDKISQQIRTPGKKVNAHPIQPIIKKSEQLKHLPKHKPFSIRDAVPGQSKKGLSK